MTSEEQQTETLDNAVRNPAGDAQGIAALEELGSMSNPDGPLRVSQRWRGRVGRQYL